MIRSLRFASILSLPFLLSPLFLPLMAAGEDAAPPDLAMILARHAEARGGKERWKSVKTLKLTGSWEAFSMPGPFTTLRAAPDRWRFDHRLFGKPAILAFDGERTWIQGAALGVAEPVRLDEPWKRNLIEDAPLLPPLLAADGVAKLELVGRGDVEGTNAWVIRATREDRPAETWYLDAKSYLEMKRESMTFDVFSGGIEIPMETFYEDFREVDGLVLPFHEERHFGTRYHVTDIESVVVDPEIAPGTFAAPDPPAAPSEQESDAG